MIVWDVPAILAFRWAEEFPSRWPILSPIPRGNLIKPLQDIPLYSGVGIFIDHYPCRSMRRIYWQTTPLASIELHSLRYNAPSFKVLSNVESSTLFNSHTIPLVNAKYFKMSSTLSSRPILHVSIERSNCLASVQSFPVHV